MSSQSDKFEVGMNNFAVELTTEMSTKGLGSCIGIALSYKEAFCIVRKGLHNLLRSNLTLSVRTDTNYCTLFLPA